jgi:tetratricopeptide (TPR) repeat protein
LLQRAVDLSDHPDVHVVVDLARVHAHRGNHADAERFAREAVAYSQQTDSPWTQGDALWDLATVLEAGGRLDDALAALREALGLYEQKEIVPVARRTRERLAALQAPTA